MLLCNLWKYLFSMTSSSVFHKNLNFMIFIIIGIFRKWGWFELKSCWCRNGLRICFERFVWSVIDLPEWIFGWLWTCWVEFVAMMNEFSRRSFLYAFFRLDLRKIKCFFFFFLFIKVFHEFIHTFEFGLRLWLSTYLILRTVSL